VPDLDLATWMAVASTVLLVLVCLGLVLRTVLIPAETRRQACCGACGHAVGDVGTLVCPECGGKYLVVGITTPASVLRLRAGLGLGVLAWTTLIFAVATVATSSAYRRAFQRAQFAWSTSFSRPSSGAAEISGENTYSPWDPSPISSGQHFHLNIKVDATDDAGLVSGTLHATLRKSGTSDTASLDFDLERGTGAIAGQDGAPLEKLEGISSEAVAHLYKAAGLNPESSSGRLYIKAIHSFLGKAVKDPVIIQNSTPISGTDAPTLMPQGWMWAQSSRGRGWKPPAPFTGPSVWSLSGVRSWWIALGALWLIGTGWIWWRYRRFRLG
jgi:hypothetical protein